MILWTLHWWSVEKDSVLFMQAVTASSYVRVRSMDLELFSALQVWTVLLILNFPVLSSVTLQFWTRSICSFDFHWIYAFQNLSWCVLGRDLVWVLSLNHCLANICIIAYTSKSFLLYKDDCKMYSCTRWFCVITTVLCCILRNSEYIVCLFKE